MNERLSDLYTSSASRALAEKKVAMSPCHLAGADPVTSSLNDPIVDAIRARVGFKNASKVD